MPRRSRSTSHIPGGLVHVICRFVDGRFILDDLGRGQYLSLLERALRRVDWILISYALMSSHIHLGLIMGDAELRTWAHPVHLRFAQWVNRRLRRTTPKVLGHVFADRPSSKPMCNSRAGVLTAYHHRNPVRAGLVEDPLESSWTSHRAYLGRAPEAGGLDVSVGLSLAGYGTSAADRLGFHQFVLRDDVRLDDVEPVQEPARSDDAIASSELSPRALVLRAATVLDVPVELVDRGARTRASVLVRRVALVAGIELGFPAAVMARQMRISESAASRLLSRPHDAGAVKEGVEHVLEAVCAGATRVP